MAYLEHDVREDECAEFLYHSSEQVNDSEEVNDGEDDCESGLKDRHF